MKRPAAQLGARRYNVGSRQAPFTPPLSWLSVSSLLSSFTLQAFKAKQAAEAKALKEAAAKMKK